MLPKGRETARLSSEWITAAVLTVNWEKYWSR